VSANSPDQLASIAPYKLYNIGNNSPVELMRFIEVMEQTLGTPAQRTSYPCNQAMLCTYADVDDLIEDGV